MARRSAANVMFTGYGLVALLAGLTALLVLIHAGRLLNFGFPLMATAVAAWLSNTRRSVYAAFVWWIWLFTPLVRRLVDYQTGYHNISPVMVTPFLVTGFALLAVMRQPRALLRRRMLPFLMVILVIIYGTVVGAATNTPLAALYDAANWLLPLAFSVFLMMSPAENAEIRDSLVFAIILGLLAISLYGLYQFYHLPAWDAYWINQSHFTTAGLGFAEQVRLFGTLNSPGPYAIVLMASLTFVVIGKGWLRVAAGGFGLTAFGLSLVRSSWGGFVVGLLFIVWRVGGKTRLRMFALGAVLAILVPVLLVSGPVADAVSKRFATFSDLQQDQSFRSRQTLYESFAVTSVSEPIGVGLGGIGVASKLVNGEAAYLDSGILLVPYQFGWLGGLVFLWAMGAMLVQIIRLTRRSSDRMRIAGGGLFLAVLSQSLFGSAFSGVSGLCLWVGLALALGAAPIQKTVLKPGMAEGFSAKSQIA
jgi:hypothetical protein